MARKIAPFAIAGAAAILGCACEALLGVNDLPGIARDAGHDVDEASEAAAGDAGAGDGGVRPGSLDPTFGEGGIAVVPTRFHRAPAVVVDGDEIVVVVPADQDGTVSVLRCSGSGGFKGFESAEIGSAGTTVSDALPVRAPDGNGIFVYVLGITDSNPYNAVDLSRVTRMGGVELMGNLHVPAQPTSAIEIARHRSRVVTFANVTTQDAGTLQVTAFGADAGIDHSFGSEGTAMVETPFADVHPKGSLLEADGRIIIVGSDHGNDQGSHTIWLRLLANGNLDRSFAQDGGGIDPSDAGPAVASGIAGDDGGYFISGTVGGIDSRALVYRLGTDGRLDSTYWDGGIYQFAPGSVDTISVEDLVALIPQPEHRIVALGTSRASGGTSKVVLLRMGRDGLDPSFAQDGMLSVVRGTLSGSHSLSIQDDGKIVIGWLGDDKVVRIARFLVQ